MAQSNKKHKIVEYNSLADHEGKPMRQVETDTVRFYRDKTSGFEVSMTNDGELEVRPFPSDSIVIRPHSSNVVRVASVKWSGRLQSRR